MRSAVRGAASARHGGTFALRVGGADARNDTGSAPSVQPSSPWDLAIRDQDAVKLAQLASRAPERASPSQVRDAMRILVRTAGRLARTDSGRGARIAQAAQQLRSAHYGAHTDPELVSLGVGAAAYSGSAQAMWDAWETAAASGITPNLFATNAVLSMLAAQGDMAGLRRVVHTQVEVLDAVGLSIVTHAFTKGYMRGAAEVPPAADVHDVAKRLRDALENASPGDAIGWHALLTYEGVMHGAEPMLQLAEAALARNAFTADAYTLSTLLLAYLHTETCSTSDEAVLLLSRLEHITHVHPGRYAVAILLRSLLVAPQRDAPARPDENQVAGTDPGRTYEAQLLYSEARRVYGIRPDSALVQPLVEAHCGAFPPALDAALALLAHVEEPTRPARAPFSLLSRWAQGRRTPGRAADAGVYHALLSACVRLHDVETARQLLERMAGRRVALEPNTATTLAMQLMRVCATFAEALGVYERVQALRVLDADAYARLLAAFCALRVVDERGAVPPDYPLQVLGDMRQAGFHPSSRTYTVLLDFYAKSDQGTSAGVRATHELIKRDVQLEPDLILINALMNAYNHVGEPAHVLGIWDTLVVLCANAGALRYVDDVSLTIVCDTCGRAQMLPAMRAVMQSARRLDKQFAPGRLITKNVLDAWVECLARCGLWHEACGVVFGEMCASASTRPDAKTVQTLLKFALNESPDTASETRARIARELPDLLSCVSDIGA